MAVSATPPAGMPEGRKRKAFRCRLGFHAYRNVGEKHAEVSPGVFDFWNRECRRCGEKG